MNPDTSLLNKIEQQYMVLRSVIYFTEFIIDVRLVLLRYSMYFLPRSDMATLWKCNIFHLYINA